MKIIFILTDVKKIRILTFFSQVWLETFFFLQEEEIQFTIESERNESFFIFLFFIKTFKHIFFHIIYKIKQNVNNSFTFFISYHGR